MPLWTVIIKDFDCSYIYHLLLPCGTQVCTVWKVYIKRITYCVRDLIYSSRYIEKSCNLNSLHITYIRWSDWAVIKWLNTAAEVLNYVTSEVEKECAITNIQFTVLLLHNVQWQTHARVRNIVLYTAHCTTHSNNFTLVITNTFFEFQIALWLASCMNLYIRSGLFKSEAREHSSLYVDKLPLKQRTYGY